MLKWVSRLLCKVGWHQGTWVYDSGPVECAQTSICQRCDHQGYRIRHDVQHWESDGSRTDVSKRKPVVQIPAGRRAGGPVGRWAGGPVGRWAGGP